MLQEWSSGKRMRFWKNDTKVQYVLFSEVLTDDPLQIKMQVSYCIFLLVVLIRLVVNLYIEGE